MHLSTAPQQQWHRQLGWHWVDFGYVLGVDLDKHWVDGYIQKMGCWGCCGLYRALCCVLLYVQLDAPCWSCVLLCVVPTVYVMQCKAGTTQTLLRKQRSMSGPFLQHCYSQQMHVVQETHLLGDWVGVSDRIQWWSQAIMLTGP